MDSFRQKINGECDYRMSEQTMDAFVGAMSPITLKNKEPLIRYGQFDGNIYVVKDGLVKFSYFDGLKEMTFGFSTPGTVVIQYHSFYNRKPSFFQVESCGESTVMKVSRSDFDALLKSSDDFKNWMLRLLAAQLWAYENRFSVLNGTAMERFESLIKNRPEILEKVSSKVIASYIGIDPSSLCRLKRDMKKQSKNSLPST